MLVVDDNPAFQDAVSELLDCMGATVLLAADGAQAVALVRNTDVDLVLMDLQMPVLDGWNATMQIRHHERVTRCERISVVAYSSSPADSELMLECGFDAALDKPCTEEALRRCLARWCVPEVASSLRSDDR